MSLKVVFCYYFYKNQTFKTHWWRVLECMKMEMGKYIFLNPTFWVDIWRSAQTIYLRKSSPTSVEGTVLREK